MKLLKPQVNNETSPELEKKKQELSLVEESVSRQNKILNDLRDEEESERIRIRKEHEAFLADKRREKQIVQDDIGKILAIKADALLPLTDKRKELDKREKAISERELIVNKKDIELQGREKNVFETAKKSERTYEDSIERQEELDKKEKKLNEEKEEFDRYVSKAKIGLKQEKERMRRMFEKKSRNKQ